MLVLNFLCYMKYQNNVSIKTNTYGRNSWEVSFDLTLVKITWHLEKKILGKLICLRSEYFIIRYSKEDHEFTIALGDQIWLWFERWRLKNLVIWGLHKTTMTDQFGSKGVQRDFHPGDGRQIEKGNFLFLKSPVLSNL